MVVCRVPGGPLYLPASKSQDLPKGHLLLAHESRTPGKEQCLQWAELHTPADSEPASWPSTLLDNGRKRWGPEEKPQPSNAPHN